MVEAGNNRQFQTTITKGVNIMADRASEVRYLNIDVDTAASHVLVAGVVGYRIVLLNFILVAAGAVTATFEDVTTGINRIGPMALAANGFITGVDSKCGCTSTASGAGLNLLLGGGVQVGGSIAYRLVPDHMEF